MRNLIVAAIVMAFGMAALGLSIGAEVKEKPKITTKAVMKTCMKDGLCKKVADGNANEDEKKTLVDEQTFLKTYVKQAEANVKYYYDLLDKITVAEKARADAAAAAAAAAKKS